MSDIVEMLRLRACPPEGEYLEHDHGHSDCYLEREAADEIERLRRFITDWADADDAYSHAAQWRDWDTIGEDQRRFEVAENALRQAVGR